MFDLDEAEQAVRAAVTQAERTAGMAVEEVLLGGGLRPVEVEHVRGRTRISRDAWSSAADIERLMAAARKHAERDGRTLLHMNCISYRLDGTAGIGDPRGLAGRTLGADLHAVTADEAPLRNLVHVVERAYLSASGLVPAPLRQRACRHDRGGAPARRRRLDIGAGTTSLAMFAQGHLLSSEVVPVGGNHVTFDIAQRLVSFRLRSRDESRGIMAPGEGRRATIRS